MWLHLQGGGDVLAPIPLIALIDTVTHGVKTKTQRGETYTESSVGHVLVQDKIMKTLVNGSPTITSSAIMFWDVQNSDSATFSIGDRITYDGRIKQIVDIVEAKTTDGVHHLELMLL